MCVARASRTCLHVRGVRRLEAQPARSVATKQIGAMLSRYPSSLLPCWRLAAPRSLPLLPNNHRRLYHKNVIEHYENPRNVGSLDKKAPNVGTGLVGAPACGDVMKLQIQVDDNDIISDAKFKVKQHYSLYMMSHLESDE